jgi:TetR/AcrR family transcriptional regulator, mexJK operon transcriptional repressor
MTNGSKTRTARTRVAILSAAEALFLKHGFSGTSMDQVAVAASVSKQTVYAHFQNKEALFLEIVDHMTGGVGDELQVQVPDKFIDRPIAGFLTDFAVQQLAFVLTPRLMQLRRLVIAETGRFPELGQLLHRRGPERSINRLTNAFEIYSKTGDFCGTNHRSAASIFNWLVMGGLINDAMLLGDGAIPDLQQQHSHSTECVRIFLAAFGTPQKR